MCLHVLYPPVLKSLSSTRGVRPSDKHLSTAYASSKDTSSRIAAAHSTLLVRAKCSDMHYFGAKIDGYIIVISHSSTVFTLSRDYSGPSHHQYRNDGRTTCRRHRLASKCARRSCTRCHHPITVSSVVNVHSLQLLDHMNMALLSCFRRHHEKCRGAHSPPTLARLPAVRLLFVVAFCIGLRRSAPQPLRSMPPHSHRPRRCTRLPASSAHCWLQ